MSGTHSRESCRDDCMEAGGSECRDAYREISGRATQEAKAEHILERRPSECLDAYWEISGTTPGMGKVELSLERKSRATHDSKHLHLWNPSPPSQAPPTEDIDWPSNSQIPLTYAPLPDIA